MAVLKDTVAKSIIYIPSSIVRLKSHLLMAGSSWKCIKKTTSPTRPTSLTCTCPTHSTSLQALWLQVFHVLHVLQAQQALHVLTGMANSQSIYQQKERYKAGKILNFLPCKIIDHVRVLDHHKIKPATSSLSACRHSKLLPYLLYLLSKLLNK